LGSLASFRIASVPLTCLNTRDERMRCEQLESIVHLCPSCELVRNGEVISHHGPETYRSVVPKHPLKLQRARPSTEWHMPISVVDHLSCIRGSVPEI
jgi:hypothetical protein